MREGPDFVLDKLPSVRVQRDQKIKKIFLSTFLSIGQNIDVINSLMVEQCMTNCLMVGKWIYNCIMVEQCLIQLSNGWIVYIQHLGVGQSISNCELFGSALYNCKMVGRCGPMGIQCMSSIPGWERVCPSFEWFGSDVYKYKKD